MADISCILWVRKLAVLDQIWHTWFILPSQFFDGFQSNHHHGMDWLGATIVFMFNSFLIIFGYSNHRVQWFQMVAHHWSNNDKPIVKQCDGQIPSLRYKFLTSKKGWGGRAVSSRSLDLLTSVIYWFRWSVFSKRIIEHRCHIHPRLSCSHWDLATRVRGKVVSPPWAPMSTMLQGSSGRSSW